MPWPFGMDRAFEPARPSSALLGMPAPFVLGLLGAAGLALITAMWLQKRLPSASQTIASRVGYPGLVLATGLGWLLPIPFYFLEMLVGVVQALVFMLLTAVFTLLICQHEEAPKLEHARIDG